MPKRAASAPAVKARTFYVPYRQPSSYKIIGVTRDSSGAALGGCTVNLFETISGAIRASTVSDAAGNYTFDVTGGGLQFFIEAYKAGSPDVAGTTVNTLTGA